MPNVQIIDRSGAALASGPIFKQRPSDTWPPIIVRAAEIDAEIERLAALERPANGRRQALFVHPAASGRGMGFAPGIQVTLDVLLPGERTEPIRHNSTQVNFCIRGGGRTVIDGRELVYRQYDVWNHPSFAIYAHVNDTHELHARLTYSNAPLLEMMHVHLIDENPEPATKAEHGQEGADPRRISPYGSFELTAEGAWLMPYELLINPPAVESRALHWPWEQVKENLDKLAALGKDYIGRRLYLLYNPMTGRTNGTTPSFFATMTIRPPKIVDRPHRHVSAAINYYFKGMGRSTVDGVVYEWGPGDLMLSAPGWGVHNHASYDEPVYELTVQDQPLNIVMESLLWQESLKEPPVILGSQPGFATNRREE